MKKKVLIFDTGGIGDIAINAMIYKAINKSCPDVSLLLLAEPWAKSIMKDEFVIDEFVPISRIIFTKQQILRTSIIQTVRFLCELVSIGKDIKPDVVISMKNSLRVNVCLFLLGRSNALKVNALYSGMYTKENLSIVHLWFNYLIKANWLLNSSIIVDLFKQHIVDSRALVFKSIFDFNIEPVLGFNDKMLPVGSSKKPRMVIFPEASHRIKEWILEYWVDIITWWKDNYQGEVIAVMRNNKSRYYIELTKYCQVIYDKSIEEICDEIEFATFVVSTDTGFAHIASLKGLPTLAIYGPVDPKHYGLLGRNTISLYQKSERCQPCYYKVVCDPEIRGCMRCINPETVIENILNMKQNHVAQ